MKNKKNTIDEIILENGFEIDLEEGWIKLASSQFGGSPGRAFPELIQNLIDSYPSTVPWEERKGEIKSDSKTVSITDWGEGMDSDRLRLLVTAGGTDKYGNKSKIGKFGLGFISLFNPGLHTREVRVVTRCEGETVEVKFLVHNPQKPPSIEYKILTEKFPWSTSITVEFSESKSVSSCIQQARNVLKYYPCDVSINGDQIQSVWKQNDNNSSLTFRDSQCHGLISRGNSWLNFKVLCKYELIMEHSLASFSGGNSYRLNELDIHHKNKTPFLKNIDVLLNINNLSVTISRDSFYLDHAYRNAKRVLNENLRKYILQEHSRTLDTGSAYANHFIFREDLGDFLKMMDEEDNQENEAPDFIQLLLNLKVYKINGRVGRYSIAQIKGMLTEKMPLYFSPEKRNLRWLEASYKHDFVVIPDEYDLAGARTDLFEKIMQDIFGDVVNLDTIRQNKSRINELLERGLISESALHPSLKIVASENYNNKEKKLLEEIKEVLNKDDIVAVIETSLGCGINTIEPVFFSVKDKEVHISTAILNSDGEALNQEYISNLLENKKDFNDPYRKGNNLLLGLNVSHPYIQQLVESNNPNRSLYALTYLAQELVSCQDKLVSNSPFYNEMKSQLVRDMRTILMDDILKNKKE